MSKTFIVSDMDIQALVDDELEAEEKIKIMDAINANHILNSRYDELVRQKKLLLTFFEKKKHGHSH